MTILEKPSLSVEALEAFATKLAAILKAGDTLYLEGDLGAGKSTFARALIRAISQSPELEVPSPTFPLLIPYETNRFPINHCDLYRIGDPSELEELGLFDELATHLTIIEWPNQLAGEGIDDYLIIKLEETEDGTARHLTLEGHGRLKNTPARLASIEQFLRAANWHQASWTFLQGDASTRSYIRLHQGKEARLLMNAPPQPDGPPIRDGKPYSQIAHLAEDMTSFIVVSRALCAAGLKAPQVEQFDIEKGLLLIGDFGDEQYYDLITSKAADQKTLYDDAIDVLAHLRQYDPEKLSETQKPGDPAYSLPPYDETALMIEADLVIDWHWPHSKGAPISEQQRAEWHSLWRPLLGVIEQPRQNWILRDYHSPNIMRLEGETPQQRIGIIDFQDALKGHAAYDVVSLCQDARLTVPPELEQQLLARYCAHISQSDKTFDEAEFKTAYAILGAQRASKLLGIFIRLAVRDGKQHYLAHLPRIWDYLERNLKHPLLSDLAAWYETNFPRSARQRAKGEDPDAGIEVAGVTNETTAQSQQQERTAN